MSRTGVRFSLLLESAFGINVEETNLGRKVLSTYFFPQVLLDSVEGVSSDKQSTASLRSDLGNTCPEDRPGNDGLTSEEEEEVPAVPLLDAPPKIFSKAPPASPDGDAGRVPSTAGSGGQQGTACTTAGTAGGCDVGGQEGATDQGAGGQR